MRRLFIPWRAVTLTLSLSISGTLAAQEQLGMRLERYSGIYSTTINPAFSTDNPNNWEVSLFNADLFFENSYAFLRNTSLPNALRNSDKILSVTEQVPETAPAPGTILLDYFDSKRKMRAELQSRLAGPSLSFRLGENHVVGITTAMRSEFSAYKIPSILAYRTISDLERNRQYSISPTGFSTMLWGEIGLHYSHSNTDRAIETSWGVSPKFLLGFEGLYTRAKTSFDYTQLIGDSSTFSSANWDYALTMGNVGDPDHARLRQQGKGFGLDAGFSWQKPAAEGSGYNWRLGVSVMDLGFVRFRKNAERHKVAFDTLVSVRDADFPGRDNAGEVLQDVSEAFLGDPNASLQGRSFAIGLPTALSVQFDKKITQQFYLSGLLIQRISLLPYNVLRPNTLAIVPRLEQRWFSVSLPVVLNDWQSMRVGAAARLGWLYLGTDNIGSLFQKRQLTGADFYVGLKVNTFSVNLNRGNKLTKESRPKRRRQQLRRIKCYFK